MGKIKSFFASVKGEMKKVRWPSKKEMLKYSAAVLICVVVFALFFTLSDVIIAAVRTWMEGL